jgi:lysozyme
VTPAALATAIIGAFEGCVLHAYKDTGGILTIGWGHTGPDVTPTLIWTQAQADAAFVKDCAPLFALVSTKPPLAQAALVSFGYNCGIGTLKRWLWSEGLPDGDSMKITMGMFIHSGGVVMDGLVRRRRFEQTLYDAAMGL